MPYLFFLSLAILLGATYADLFPTTVTQRFWQSGKSAFSRDSSAKTDRRAHTAIVVKDYLYVIGGEQYDSNLEYGLTFGKSFRLWL